MTFQYSKPKTVPVPDEVFDVALKELTDAELRVLLVIINKTLRWGKSWDWIDESQFIDACGGTLSNAGIYYALNGRIYTSAEGKTYTYEGLVKKGHVLRKYTCSHCKYETLEFESTCPNCKHGKTYKPFYALNLGEDLVTHFKDVRNKKPSNIVNNTPNIVRTQETSLQETSTNVTDQTNTAGDVNDPLQIAKNDDDDIESQKENLISSSMLKQQSHAPAKEHLANISIPRVSKRVIADHSLPPPETEFNVKFCSHPIYNFFLANTSQKLIEFIPDSDKAVLRELKEREVPENVIKAGIKFAIQAHKPRFSRDYVRSLKYCEPAIYQLFEKWENGEVDIPLTEKETTDKMMGFFDELLSSLDEDRIKVYINEGFMTENRKPTAKFIAEWEKNDNVR